MQIISANAQHKLAPLFLPCDAKKTTWLNSCFNEIKFLCATVILLMLHNGFFIIFTKFDFLIVAHFYCYVTMIHLPFCCKRFFNLNISKTIQDRQLKFAVKDRGANDLRKNFQKMLKFWHCLFIATQGRITLELRVFKYLSFFTFYLLNNCCEIVHFKNGGTGPPNTPPLSAPVISVITNDL